MLDNDLLILTDEQRAVWLKGYRAELESLPVESDEEYNYILGMVHTLDLVSVVFNLHPSAVDLLRVQMRVMEAGCDEDDEF